MEKTKNLSNYHIRVLFYLTFFVLYPSPVIFGVLNYIYLISKFILAGIIVMNIYILFKQSIKKLRNNRTKSMKEKILILLPINIFILLLFIYLLFYTTGFLENILTVVLMSIILIIFPLELIFRFLKSRK